MSELRPNADSAFPLAIITSYFDFNKNPWMYENTRYCVNRWREAGAFVILVEFALHNETYAYAIQEGHVTISEHPSLISDVVVGIHVDDIMWYKEVAVNVGLRYVPKKCNLIGWFDNDIVFAESPSQRHDAQNSWIWQLQETFKMNPSLSLVQPFCDLARTTESIRTELFEQKVASDESILMSQEDKPCDDLNKNMSKKETIALSLANAVEKCKEYARISKSVIAMNRRGKDGSMLGVTGCAWVARARTLKTMKLFSHTMVGGGDDLHLNLWLGTTTSNGLRGINTNQQRWYFGERQDAKNAGLRHILARYRKKMQSVMSLPAKLGCLPFTLVHIFHGELENKSIAQQRYEYLIQREFRASSHIQLHPTVQDCYAWSDSFRESSLQADMKISLERSQSVREKVLLRVAKMQRFLYETQQNVEDLLKMEATTIMQGEDVHQNLSTVLRNCLKTVENVVI